MRHKRRSRGYRSSSRKGAKLNFAPVIIILCLSVGCGYATAKYVVEPAVNYIPQLTAEETKKDSTEGLQKGSADGQQKEAVDEKRTEKQENGDAADKQNVVEDDVDVKETGKVAGYALQFGCYSSQSAAETVLPTLGVENLQIIEQDGMYKIVGETYKTKASARDALQKLPETAHAFVTTLYQ